MYMIHITKKQVIALGLSLLIMSAYLFKELNAMEKSAGLIDKNPISTPYVNIFNEDKFTFDSMYDFMDR